MLKKTYTKEQIEAMDDLCQQFKKHAYTIGEISRLMEAKRKLLERERDTLSQRLKRAWELPA